MDARRRKRHVKTEDAQKEEVEAKRPKAAEEPVNSFLAQWLWKREAKSDVEKFEQPYEYPCESGGVLVVQQLPFSAEGFASTVWDSAIVLSKYLEKQGAKRFAGKSVCELGAGCGLLSVVLRHLGARVVATDLECNLPLLRRNVTSGESGITATASPLVWGKRSAEAVLRDANGGAAFDVVVASDVMYIIDAVPDLVNTMKALSGHQTAIWLAYGRNRTAEDVFMRAAKQAGFTVTEVVDSELHEVYQCLDVTVLSLRLKCSSASG